MTLAINAQGLVKQFIENYCIWRDNNNFYHKQICPVLVNDINGIKCFHYTDVDNINLCEDKLIAIDCLTEGIHSRNFFNSYNKNKHYIIFSNGWWDVDHAGIDQNYSLVNHLFFLFEMSDTYMSSNRFCFYLDKEYKFDYPKPHVFASLIGNVKSERTYLVDKLISTINYKNFILRYSGENFGCNVDELDVIQFTKGNFDPYIPILEKYYHNVSQSLPIKIYNQSYFNLVVETDINYDHSFFLTEKTIKPLIIGMPFVIVSTPFFLKHLKKLGFCTYGELWNEDYDQEIDYKTRIDKIIDLVVKLKDFDWNGNKSKLKEISRQNQLNFLNLNHQCNLEFKNLEDCIKKLV